ncbi:hypothetical protein BT69DRAFT_1278099 [Atractiella rhizophila]|nr:hypothetical protein BT69DRAFT_1278099 [Atractiella rhizophila]
MVAFIVIIRTTSNKLSTTHGLWNVGKWNVGKGMEDYQTVIFTTAATDSFSVVVSSSVPHILCFIPSLIYRELILAQGDPNIKQPPCDPRSPHQ